MRLLWLSLAAVPMLATSYTLQGLSDHALKNHTSLQAERETFQQLFYQKEAARLWENPELSLSYARTKPDLLSDQNEFGVSLMQPIEKPSLRSARQKELDAKVVQAQALYHQKENDLSGEIRQKAYLYLVASLMVQKAEESSKLVTSLRQKGESRFAQGAISKADLLKLQVEEEKTAQEAKIAIIKRDAAKNALILSAQINPSDEILLPSLPEPVHVDMPSSIDHLPMIAYYKALQEQSRIQQEIADESVIPGFKAGIGYQKNYDQKSLIASLSVPIPILHRNEPLIRSAQSRQSENRLREAAYRYEITQKTTRQIETINSLADLIASQEQLISKAETMVTLSRRSYEEGYGTLLELIDARRVLITYQNALLNNMELYYDTLGELQKTFPPIEEKR